MSNQKYLKIFIVNKLVFAPHFRRVTFGADICFGFDLEAFEAAPFFRGHFVLHLFFFLLILVLVVAALLVGSAGTAASARGTATSASSLTCTTTARTVNVYWASDAAKCGLMVHGLRRSDEDATSHGGGSLGCSRPGVF